MTTHMQTRVLCIIDTARDIDNVRLLRVQVISGPQGPSACAHVVFTCICKLHSRGPHNSIHSHFCSHKVETTYTLMYILLQTLYLKWLPLYSSYSSRKENYQNYFRCDFMYNMHIFWTTSFDFSFLFVCLTKKNLNIVWEHVYILVR